MNDEKLWQRLTTIYDTGEAKAIVRMLLEVRFGLSLTDIVCGKLEQMTEQELQELEVMMKRLEKGEPVQYVLGVADFCGRSFHVEPGVLIPRPETAMLCEIIISLQKKAKKQAPHILDIGTGSGCIAITLALDLPRSRVKAWDISDAALRIAQENANSLGAKVTFEKQDALLAANGQQPVSNHYDIIVSNPPYIQPSESDEMEKNVLNYEPQEALFAPKNNPIIFYQCIADEAWATLNTEGMLFFELNPLTADAVALYVQQLGFSDVELLEDQYGKQRFLKAIKI